MDLLLLGLLFSLLVSACLAFVEKDGTKAQRKYFIKTFCYFFLSILLFGWIMAFLPR